ncbi:MAG: FAD-dependent oxidoreductase, partial [bacterium]
VTLVTPTKSLLPIADKYLDNYIFDKLQKDGVNILVEKNIKEYKNGKLYAGEHEIKCEKVLNASMRGAVLPPSDIDIALDYGYIKTDENLKTTYENIYAVGDVNGKSFLAHVGSAQGLYVINKIKGIKGAIDLHNYPINIYTNPEMAQIGLTEQELQSENIPYKVSEFPLSANGKALIEGYEDGSVRMLSEKRYGEVLGVQIIAPHATDMIAEAAAFMQIEGTVYDVAKLIHAHPTISEVFMEAGFDAVDKAIHK